MRELHVIDIHVGQRLKTLRSERNISQKELAKKICASRQQISRYEKGESRIPASVLFELAQTLNVSILDFYKGLDASAIYRKIIRQRKKLQKHLNEDKN